MVQLPLWVVGAALAAQAPSAMPDSATRARFQVVIDSATNTLDPIRGAGAEFRTDLSSASPALVLARAGRVRRSCEAARVAVVRAHEFLGSRSFAQRTATQQAKLREAGAGLRRTLERCLGEWDPAPYTAQRADTLRAWGPYRVLQLDEALARYGAAVRVFQRAAGLEKPARH
jgi:hypothetical protein